MVYCNGNNYFYRRLFAFVATKPQLTINEQALESEKMLRTSSSITLMQWATNDKMLSAEMRSLFVFGETLRGVSVSSRCNTHRNAHEWHVDREMIENGIVEGSFVHTAVCHSQGNIDYISGAKVNAKGEM